MLGHKDDILHQKQYILSRNYSYHSSYMKIIALIKEISYDFNQDQPSTSSSEKIPLFSFETSPPILISLSNSEKYSYDNIFLDIVQLYNTEIEPLISLKQDLTAIFYGPTYKDILFQKVLELTTKDIFINNPQVKISCNMIVDNDLLDLIEMTKIYEVNIAYADIINEATFNQVLFQALNNRVNSLQNDIPSHLYISIIIENKNMSEEKAVDNFFEINLLSLDFFNDYNNTLVDFGENLISCVRKDQKDDNRGQSFLSYVIRDKLINSNIVLVNCLDYYAITDKSASINDRANVFIKWIKDSIQLKEENESDAIDEYENKKNELGNDSVYYSDRQVDQSRDSNSSIRRYQNDDNRLHYKQQQRYLNRNDNYLNYEDNNKIMMNKSPNKKNLENFTYTITNQVNNKNDIMQKRLDNLYEYNNINSYMNNNNNINNTYIYPKRWNSDISKNEDNINNNKLTFKLKRVNEDKSLLISNNLIYREDINRLNDLNRNLESELYSQRQRNCELSNDNDLIKRENLSIQLEIDKANELINQAKINEKNFIVNLNECTLLENKIKDIECEINKVKEENDKKNMDYMLMIDEYNELCSKNSQTLNELDLVKNVQNEQISAIEDKLTVMTEEVYSLRKENVSLKDESEKYKGELIKMQELKNKYKEKFKEQKNVNDLLNDKVNEIEKEFIQYQKELEEKELILLKEEEIKKCKIESKNKIINDLKKRIANYKNERIKSKSNNVE